MAHGFAAPMNIYLYIFSSIIFIMIVSLALAIKNQFNLFLVGMIFVVGGIIGYIMNSLEIGFVLSVILSLMFW